MLIPSSLIFVLATFAPSTFSAVSLSPPAAPPNTIVETSIRVYRGCANTGTTRVSVEFPNEIVFANAQTHPGWKVEFQYRNLSAPASVEGASVTSAVSTISWYDNVVEPDYYEDFGLLFQSPAVADGTKVFFTISQNCKNPDTPIIRQTAAVTINRNGTLLSLSDLLQGSGVDAQALVRIAASSNNPQATTTYPNAVNTNKPSGASRLASAGGMVLGAALMAGLVSYL
ncbi:hypothetical protein HDU97_000588 [Phlyctochytrium planicorne]|nr:hypothetical protein HDU97_000588 [Phlyctochytrium planicorne]